MKKRTFSKYLKQRRALLFFMPIVTIMLFIFAVNFMVSFPQDLGIGLSFLGLAIFSIAMFFIGLILMNRAIKKAEAEEAEEALKDEKIKKLEEKLQNVRNDG